MDYLITKFNTTWDTDTKKSIKVSGIDGLNRFFGYLSSIKYKTKKSAPLISPAIYKKNTKRSNDNTIRWGGWAAMDIDQHHFDANNIENDVKESYHQYSFICYSTASSTKNNPKFRIVFPLKSLVEKNIIPDFWYALGSFIKIPDKQCKDLSRMYYVPGTYDGAYNFFFTHTTKNIIDPYDFISMYPNPHIGEKSIKDDLAIFIRDRIKERRKNIKYISAIEDNNLITWTSYKNCPFIHMKLIREYTMTRDTGWYAKMYSIMVSIAGSALKKEYYITPQQIATLCEEIDQEHGGWYQKRNFVQEAERALRFIYSRA